MKKNIFVYSLRTQYGNLGDFVINKILIDYLRLYGELVVDNFSVPQWFNAKLNVTSYESRLVHRPLGFNAELMILAIKNYFLGINTYLILTPGHIIYDNVPLTKLIFRLIYLILLSSLKVRICRFGASIGPFTKKVAYLESFQAKLMYFYSVRDVESEKYAKSIGIQNVQLFPDLAWALKTESLIFPKLNFDERSTIIFSFRDYKSVDSKSSSYKDNLFQTLDTLVEFGFDKIFKKITVSYQVDKDKNLSSELSKRYSDYNLNFIDENLDFENALHLYSEASVVCSNRLHVLMLAMKVGALPLGICDPSNHKKIPGIFRDASLEDLVFDLSKPLDLNRVHQVFLNRSEYLSKINIVSTSNTTIVNSILTSLMS